ncbi:Multiple C2 and transmembrane domain-containing protein 1 [Triticum urartu]|uniref:Multiple C2 and transmembrane domain-containing protein 1 n=1 Tax=Triticum urartu TaxID=4572 RepID=M7ZRM7_TRIUA|nr:Multiple C2 and transmembrane domain-containing protein 1 [Triticum urartu]
MKLAVEVADAAELSAKDGAAGCNAFVEVEFDGQRQRTATRPGDLSPQWNETLVLGVRDPARLAALTVDVSVQPDRSLNDHNALRPHVFLGRVRVSGESVARSPDEAFLQRFPLDKRGLFSRVSGDIALRLYLAAPPGSQYGLTETKPPLPAKMGPRSGTAKIASTYDMVEPMSYLYVTVVKARDLPSMDLTGALDPYVEVKLGNFKGVTRHLEKNQNPVWRQTFAFSGAHLQASQLEVIVMDKDTLRDDFVGRVVFDMSDIPSRLPPDSPLAPQWYSLADAHGERFRHGHPLGEIMLAVWIGTQADEAFPEAWHSDAHSLSREGLTNTRSKVYYSPKLIYLKVGILSARGLGGNKSAYCVAKYGSKWVRTRTLLGTAAPAWNEQYTWEVFDLSTVITVAVFDNNHLHHSDGKDQRIGKVRVRLATLESDRVYTHYYPLMALTPGGLKKTGELHLAVRFTCTAWANMLAQYGRPLLPKMHYSNPISVLQLDYLRFQAMQMVATRLEPPLHREVVEYMLDVDSHMFSLRRSKANFYRITSLFSGVVAVGKWFDGICKWKNPLTTILVHVLFLILVCYPELILPTVFLYLFMIGVWNYRRRPRKPPHMDTVLSHAEQAHPDELDEEFDTFPTSKPSDVVRMRYDRLRSVAGRVQTVVGDLAMQGERAQSLLSWRDPRATAIFITLSLIVAVVLYITPFQVVAVVLGLYMLRHPRFRSKQPSVPFNFYKRLPAKGDMLL